MTSGSPSAARFEAALGALVPPGAACAARLGDEADVPPLAGPGEAEAVARAVPARRAEFARGRACARAALVRAGWTGPPPEIPVGPGREPVWPKGFVGSITHCAGLVAAVVAPVGIVRAIGIDAEPARPLPTEVVPSIMTERERQAVAAATGSPYPDTLVFSAKESVHKAVHPLTGVWLDFLDVTVAFDPLVARPGDAGRRDDKGRPHDTAGPGTFRVGPARPADGPPDTLPVHAHLHALAGCHLTWSSWVVTLVHLQGDAPAATTAPPW